MTGPRRYDARQDWVSETCTMFAAPLQSIIDLDVGADSGPGLANAQLNTLCAVMIKNASLSASPDWNAVFDDAVES